MSNEENTQRKTRFFARDERAQAPGNPVAVVLTVVVVAVAAIVGLMILSSVAGVAVEMGSSSGEVSYDPVTGEEEVIDENIEDRPALLEISLTTGSGVELSGENSYVDLNSSGAFDNGSWTVMAAGELDEEANQAGTYSLLAHDSENVTIAFSGGEWVAWYIDENGDSARVSLPAEEPTEFSAIALAHNDTANTIQLTVDGQTSSEQALDEESIERPLQWNWPGVVDEYRFFPGLVDQAERERLTETPTAGTNENQTARYMLDEGEGTTSKAYYSDAKAELVNADWGDGLDDPGLEENVDYSVTVNPLAVTTLADGLADGSPVLYVEWDDGLGATLQSMIDGIGSALSLVAILLIVLVAGLVIATIGRLR